MPIAKFGYWLFIGALFGNIVVWAFIPSLGMHAATYLVLLALSLVGLALWFFFSLDRIVQWFKRRSTQFGLSLALMALMSFLILGFINWVAVKQNVKKDLTANQLHTLSDQTRRILAQLDDEVVVRVWTTNVNRISSNIDMQGFLENYRMAGNGKVAIDIRNPNEFSAEAELDQIRRDNVIVVRTAGAGREARVENFSDSRGEEQLTNAIVQATKGQKKMLCFVSGHGQASIENSEAQGLSAFKDALEKSNYDSREILLANEESIPEDCELLANMGPRNPPLERELKLLQDYLSAGGTMLALVGPRASVQWREFFKAYGVEVRQDLLIDPLQQSNPIFVSTRNYAQDVEVTRDFALTTVFPEVSSIKVPMQVEDPRLSVRTFISSEARSYAKRGEIQGITNIRPSSGDLRGPVPIGVFIEQSLKDMSEINPDIPAAGSEQSRLNDWKWPSLIASAQAQGMDDFDDEELAQGPTLRAIVFSSDLFAVNGVVAQVGNMDLLLNSVNFLLKDEELIGIRPRDIRQTYLSLTHQDIRKVWGFILITAGLFLVFGIRAARRKAVLA
jgi:ABC-type uncharacterized transport system involved in gliding motility auxiliary subunit